MRTFMTKAAAVLAGAAMLTAITADGASAQIRRFGGGGHAVHGSFGGMHAGIRPGGGYRGGYRGGYGGYRGGGWGVGAGLLAGGLLLGGATYPYWGYGGDPCYRYQWVYDAYGQPYRQLVNVCY